MSIQFNPLLPLWLSVPLLAVLLAAIGYGSWTLRQKQVARNWQITLACLRGGLFLTFLAILAQPAMVTTRNIPQLPEMIVLIDASRSMNRSTANGTRLDEVRGVLSHTDLAATLQERYRLHWFAFADSARPIDPASLSKLQSDGTHTQIAESMDAAYRQLNALGKKPQRVLLVSDGNDRGEADPVGTARTHGLIVDVLATNSIHSELSPGIEITDVQGARRVLLESETAFRVTVASKTSANADRRFNLIVTEDGKKVLDHTGTLPARRTEKSVVLAYRPKTAGVKQYEFTLDDGKPHVLPVQVVDNKFEVLILEDRWRWEYKYLGRVLDGDPSLRFSALLARGGGAVMQFGSADRRVKLIGFPQSQADLEDFDTFILGDVATGRWPTGLAKDLARQITEHGRSMVVIAGPGLSDLAANPELHPLLPVELTPESGTPIMGPIEVRFRADAAQSPFFSQAGEGDGKLPPMDQIYPAKRKRPGATVLLEATQHRNVYGPQIVIAEHTVGRGRVLFVGTDTLWKWHTLGATKDGPTPYSIFWQQAFRALAPAHSGADGIQLWLTLEKSRTEVGRSIAVHAEAHSSRSLPQVRIQATATTPDDKRQPLAFAADPSNPRSFRAEYLVAQKGLHRISATLQSGSNLAVDRTIVLHADEPRGEENDAGVDLLNLARIAQDTGGRVIDPRAPETWPTPSDIPLAAIVQSHTIDLWSNFTLLLLLVAILGSDWFLRLFKGLIGG